MKLTPEKFPYLKNYRMPHGYELQKRKRKLAEENFKIVTLGENVSLSEGDIVTGIFDYAINQITKLLGGRTDQITAQHWLQAMPGSGYWTTKYRNYLIKHFYYSDMLHKIPTFTQYFVHENLFELSDGKYQNLSTSPIQGELGSYVAKFYKILEKERGNSNIGTPGPDYKTAGFNFSNGSDLQTILLIGAGIGLLFAVINKKKR